MKKVGLMLVAAAAALVCGLSARADSWALPTPQKYYSQNKRYYVEVIPRQLESQLKYFEDKSAKREPAGGKQRHLILQVVSKWSGAFEDKPEYKELRVDLKTGELVREERPAE